MMMMFTSVVPRYVHCIFYLLLIAVELSSFNINVSKNGQYVLRLDRSETKPSFISVTKLTAKKCMSIRSKF